MSTRSHGNASGNGSASNGSENGRRQDLGQLPQLQLQHLQVALLLLLLLIHPHLAYCPKRNHYLHPADRNPKQNHHRCSNRRYQPTKHRRQCNNPFTLPPRKQIPPLCPPRRRKLPQSQKLISLSQQPIAPSSPQQSLLPPLLQPPRQHQHQRHTTLWIITIIIILILPGQRSHSPISAWAWISTWILALI